MTITIEVDQNSSLARHIEDLQRVISKRNKRIEELENRLSGEGESEFIQRIKQQEYSRGYKAASSNLMEATRKFEELLKNVNREAFSAYLLGDKIGWNNETYEEVRS